jgi:hypothetical protein
MTERNLRPFWYAMAVVYVIELAWAVYEQSPGLAVTMLGLILFARWQVRRINRNSTRTRRRG